MLVTKIAAVAMCFTMGFSPQTAELITAHNAKGTYDARYDFDGDGEETVLDAIKVLKRYYENIDNNATITINEEIMETLLRQETDEEVLYWEIDFIDDEPCRKYEYTTAEEIRIHVYYETENECSGFQVVMNPFTEQIYTD